MNTIEKYGFYNTDKAFLTLDKHCWCLCIDLLKCAKEDTGDRIELSTDILGRKYSCNAAVYRLVYSKEYFKYSGLPEDIELFVAIGKTDECYTLVCNNNESFDNAISYLNRKNNTNHSEIK